MMAADAMHTIKKARARSHNVSVMPLLGRRSDIADPASSDPFDGPVQG